MVAGRAAGTQGVRTGRLSFLDHFLTQQIFLSISGWRITMAPLHYVSWRNQGNRTSRPFHSGNGPVST